MKTKHILTLSDLNTNDIQSIIDRSVAFATGKVEVKKTLLDKIIGIYFRKTSTRTRTSFSVAALKLGANIIGYGPNDLQTNTGETIEDTTKILAGYLDALVIRTAASETEMQMLANQDNMSVINAMNEIEHPTQALADLSTIKEHFGRLKDIHILYMGEGNNSATALALAVSKISGMKLTLLTPAGFGLPSKIYNQVVQNLSEVSEYHDLDELPSKVDVVYTTRWQTTGTSKDDPNWREKFRPFSVTESLMQQISTPNTVFMHDLPAVRGDDVESVVLEGSQSIAFRQAQHKMFSAMAVLEYCLLN